MNIDSAVIAGDPDTVIENIEYDSRLIKPNGLFFAVEGYKQNGYDFIPDAIKNGAVAVMGEREEVPDIPVYVQVPDIRQAMADVSATFYGYPGLKIKACGVTGTNGKTTTCFLIKKILEARNKKVGLITSQVYDTGKQTFAAERTTPEALDIQRLMLLMKQNYCVNAVVEVSSHALELKRVEHINFRIAVYTNITRDHLDFHESMEKYLQAKMKLMEKLEGPLSYAIINLDVPEFRQLFGEFSSSYMSYSLENDKADLFCSSYEIKPNGTIFDLVTPMGTHTVHLKLPGRFNLYNALAAAGGGFAAGVDVDNVVDGLEAAQPVPGRFNYVESGQPFAVYVDYAHTPDAIQRLCETARELTGGRLFVLFGCGGDRDKGKRPMMGTAATEFSDYAVVTSDNPRSEDPLAIIEDIKPGLKGDQYEIIPDRKEAIAHIVKQAQKHDTVLVAGKGAENYQEINGVRHPFSDTEEILTVLQELGYSPNEAFEEN